MAIESHHVPKDVKAALNLLGSLVVMAQMLLVLSLYLLAGHAVTPVLAVSVFAAQLARQPL